MENGRGRSRGLKYTKAGPIQSVAHLAAAVVGCAAKWARDVICHAHAPQLPAMWDPHVRVFFTCTDSVTNSCGRCSLRRDLCARVLGGWTKSGL